MSNLDNLTSKIKTDAEVKKTDIINTAIEKADTIVGKKVEEAQKKASSIIEKAKEDSKSIKERTISKAELDVRNSKLAAKQSVIESVFKKAKDRLNNMSSKEFAEFAEDIITRFELDGDETILMNDENIEKLPENFLENINEKLKAKGIDGKLIIESNNRVNGGFILSKNGIEINCSFDELVNSLRYDLEYEVGSILFSK